MNRTRKRSATLADIDKGLAVLNSQEQEDDARGEEAPQVEASTAPAPSKAAKKKSVPLKRITVEIPRTLYIRAERAMLKEKERSSAGRQTLRSLVTVALERQLSGGTGAEAPSLPEELQTRAEALLATLAAEGGRSPRTLGELVTLAVDGYLTERGV